MNVRPIRSTDEAAYRDILERTTEDDRYCRFFHVVDHFDPAEVHRYVEPRSDTLGFIAFEKDVPLGCAHAVALDDAVAELAIVVAHDARRRGVGRALVAALTAELARRGLHRLVAVSLAQNASFTRLAAATGLVLERSDGMKVHWTLDLGGMPPRTTSGAEREQPV